MNGGAATTTTGLGSSAYSFYLNLVVLNQVVPSTASSSSVGEEEEETNKTEAPTQETPAPNLAPAAAREEAEDDAANAKADADADAVDASAGAGDRTGGTLVRKGGLLDGMTMPTMTATMSVQLKALGFGGKGSLDKSLHNTMKAVSKRSVAISDRASRYVAGKTMVTRASAALDKALPEVVAIMSQSGAGGSGTKLDMTVGRRFQQGPVMVLQVDLKASGLPAYVEAARGEDAAEHYRCAASSLRLLGAESTARELEREMLPLARRGLMERMSEELVRTMKAKDESGAPLEVECIALEEGDEARWLFTYMEFQSQMK